MMKFILLLLALAMPIAAFGSDDAANSLLSGPDVDFAKSLVADLQAKHYDAIEAEADVSLRTGDLRATLAQMSSLLPAAPPRSVEVGVTRVFTLYSAQTTRRVTIFLQYEFSDRWLLTTLGWHSTAGGPNVIDTFRLQPLPASLETINRFTFRGKGVTHFVILAAMIAAPVFSLGVLVLCLRTPMPRVRKALWVVGMLLGVASLRFNWTTGGVSLDPLSVQLLSAGCVKASQLSPWMLSVSVPLAAIVFLVRRRAGNFVPASLSPDAAA